MSTASSTAGSSVRAVTASTYTPGTPFTVEIEVYPLSTTQYYAVEDGPPSGWTVSNVSDGGSLDTAKGMVKWGPFADNVQRRLSYTVTPAQGATGTQVFDGTLSLDGSSTQTSGASSVSLAP